MTFISKGQNNSKRQKSFILSSDFETLNKIFFMGGSKMCMENPMMPNGLFER